MALEHPLLRSVGVAHAFGVRGDAPPTRVVRPVQVHGKGVTSAEHCAAHPKTEADGIVAERPFAGVIAVVTADCVPVLAADERGRAVAALHAGWRGLAAGVVEAGIAALRARTDAARLVATIGPHIGPCCYEVDAPVVDALRARHGAAADAALRASRPGHWQLDLGAVTRAALDALGLAGADVGRIEGACTACDAERFHSYRRDGPRAGRLLHWIAPGS